MKKILLTIFLLQISIIPVLATDNKLYLTENNNKIYYNKDMFNPQKFMYHIDMLPGGSYTDDLTIENVTGFPLTLYLKVEEIEQKQEANELLDSIFMKVYLNNNIIYDGKVKGLDYISNGINLQDSIILKEFAVNESAKIKVELTLAKEYDNIEFNEFTYLKWKFIAQFDKNNNEEPKDPTPPTDDEKEPTKEQEDKPVIIEVVPAPSTGINKNYLPIITSSIGLCVVGCMILILAKKRKD